MEVCIAATCYGSTGVGSVEYQCDLTFAFSRLRAITSPPMPSGQQHLEQELGLECEYVRHPSQGGATLFEEAMRRAF